MHLILTYFVFKRSTDMLFIIMHGSGNYNDKYHVEKSQTFMNIYLISKISLP